jgi:hypothetical protein
MLAWQASFAGDWACDSRLLWVNTTGRVAHESAGELYLKQTNRRDIIMNPIFPECNCAVYPVLQVVVCSASGSATYPRVQSHITFRIVQALWHRTS